MTPNRKILVARSLIILAIPLFAVAAIFFIAYKSTGNGAFVYPCGIMLALSGLIQIIATLLWLISQRKNNGD